MNIYPEHKIVNEKYEIEEFNGDTSLICNTLSYNILQKHNKSDSDIDLKISFDSLTSHDITSVNIIQTAKAIGLKKFEIPYVFTNCHNSLCTVGGTINEDDHAFVYSAAKKYGGIYVPANLAVIHSYNRDMMTKVGAMILGSDSHTRYGALGTMGIGEGGGELVKQLIGGTYNIKLPQTVAIILKGKPKNFVGPHDVSLALIKEVFDSNIVKNRVLEFMGDGISNLSIDFRNSIDTMTTEMASLSTIWETDNKVKDFYKSFDRECDFKELKLKNRALYSAVIEINLGEIEPMIALPFHPKNAYTIKEVKANPAKIFSKIDKNIEKFYPNSIYKLSDKIYRGDVYVDQALIVGCAGGTCENISNARQILKNKNIGNAKFNMSVYPQSVPSYLSLSKNGIIDDLVRAGVLIKPSFCGPCFGAGDTPASGEFSIRNATRNFPYREGSIPSENQASFVALMDAKSIAATALNKGRLTGADELEEYQFRQIKFEYDKSIYKNRVTDCFKRASQNEDLILGPNIKSWPNFCSLKSNLLLKVCSIIFDEVTTTDELIPSGETASYRSNPFKLAEYTLSKKDPFYVKRALEVKNLAKKNTDILKNILSNYNLDKDDLSIGSTIFAKRPGDGSAREQAASSQKILGGWANIAIDYATKRYRTNLINWGLLPFRVDAEDFKEFSIGDYILVEDILKSLVAQKTKIVAKNLTNDKEFYLYLDKLSRDETNIIISGGLINYYKNKKL